MSKRTKAKPPKSPEDIAEERRKSRERDFEAVNLPAGSACLSTFADVQVAHAQKDKIDSARRMDAFLALQDGMQTGAYDAARRLEADIAARHAEGDKQAGERVDCGSGIAGITDRQVLAGSMVDAVLARVGPRDAWLLVELIRPTRTVIRDASRRVAETEERRYIATLGAMAGERRAGIEAAADLEAKQLRGGSWRDVVAYVTGEDNPVAQGAAVRSACANLAAAYKLVDEQIRLAA